MGNTITSKYYGVFSKKCFNYIPIKDVISEGNVIRSMYYDFIGFMVKLYSCMDTDVVMTRFMQAGSNVIVESPYCVKVL